MDPPRFFHPDLDGEVVVLAEAEARHALLSLRLRPGDPITLFNGAGRVATATIAAPPPEQRSPARGRKLQLSARITRLVEVPPPRRRLTLVVPGCKGTRLDVLIEKCTELGVSRIVLAEFARSVVRPGEAHVDRLWRTAVEACKQCGRAWVPKVSQDTDFVTEAAVGVHHVLLVAHPDPAAPRLIEKLLQHQAAEEFTVVIGPEGGLADDELQTLCCRGGETVRLAEHVLRVETAAIAAAAQFAVSL